MFFFEWKLKNAHYAPHRQETINNHYPHSTQRGPSDLKDEKTGIIKAGPRRIVLFFLLSIVLLVLGILVIMLTFGTSLGRIILMIVGVVLVIVGSIIMFNGIRDLIRAIRS
jgi:hypothetical protein